MKILLVRTSALGDIVHCLPVLTALRREWPDAEIAWAVEEVWAPLLEGHPDIDRLIPVRSKAWRKMPPLTAWLDIRRCSRELRSFGADVTFDLMGNHKGALLARWSRAPRIIGAARADRRESSSAVWVKETVALGGAVHAVDKALALLGPLDVETDPVDFGGDRLLPSPPAFATPLVEELDALRTAGRPVVSIQAGAGWASKTWPADWFGEVARGLSRETGADVRVLLAPGEEHLAERVVAASEGAARTVPTFDFRVLAAVLRRSDLLLGGDTGPLHLAHALGTPVLCLIGPTDPARNGPYGDPDGVAFRQLPCSYCYKRFDEPKACLLQLTPRMVLRRALAHCRTRM
ncbi:MAG: glycosyltransferase family 9 protein [Thermoanaerobaculia bacterium]|nr:glycosyltransferase family 9 protein [Thermoanaerobaculia bacterium]